MDDTLAARRGSAHPSPKPDLVMVDCWTLDGLLRLWPSQCYCYSSVSWVPLWRSLLSRRWAERSGGGQLDVLEGLTGAGALGRDAG